MERASVRRTPEGTPLEAALTKGLHHLGVMQTLAHASREGDEPCWLVFEYCNRGCVAVREAVWAVWAVGIVGCGAVGPWAAFVTCGCERLAGCLQIDMHIAMRSAQSTHSG